MIFTIEKGKNNKIKSLEANDKFIEKQEDMFVEACQDNKKTIKHYRNSKLAQSIGAITTLTGALMFNGSQEEIAVGVGVLVLGAATMAVGTINKLVDRYILLNDAKVDTICKNYDKVGVECSHDEIVDDMIK